MNEHLDNFASRRIQTLNELADRCGEIVWLVAQDNEGSEHAILYGDSEVRPWRIGGFAKYNRSKGLKPFWPRVPVSASQEVFCAGLPIPDRNPKLSIRDDQVEAFRVRSYNIPPYMESRVDRLAVNYAIFSSEHDAMSYRTAIMMLYRRKSELRYPHYTDQQRFRYSVFQKRFFLMGAHVAQQSEEHSETVSRVLKGQTPAF